MLVLARVRPSHSSSSASCIFASTSLGSEYLSVCHSGTRTASTGAGFQFRSDFRYSRVLHESSQEDVWSAANEPLQRALAEGEAACVLAYGQTGSGKTHTVFGGACGTFRERGVAQRALSLVFATADAQRARMGGEEPSTPAFIAFAEVYAEGVFDLIGTVAARAAGAVWGSNGFLDGESAASAALTALASRGVRACRADTESVALALVHAGTLARATGATALNRASSRSHAVLVVTLGRTAIFLVDLAGSERRGYGRSSQDQTHQREGASINLSLHCLELVIMSLAERQAAQRERAKAKRNGMPLPVTPLTLPSALWERYNIDQSPMSSPPRASPPRGGGGSWGV